MNMIKLFLSQMTKGHKMGMAIAIGIALLALSAGIINAKFIAKQDDSAVEEALEEIAEDATETALGLPDDALKGKFDITPSSKEK